MQPPRDESLNGLLQGYRIYYRELEYEAAPATESKMLKTPSALRAELTGEPRPHGGGSHNHHVCPPQACWEQPWGPGGVRLCPLPSTPTVCKAQGTGRGPRKAAWRRSHLRGCQGKRMSWRK